jgi:F-type H+-transporting ATPase subunit alpha
MKQQNYAPVPVEEQVVAIWAGTEGKLDDIPVGEIRRFEAELMEYMRRSHEATLTLIADGNWDDDVIAALDKAVASFKERFLAKEETPRVNELEAEAMDAEAEAREKVTRVRPKVERR